MDSADGEGITVDDSNDDVARWEPAIGMCFASLDDGKSFYGEYALRKGFGWKTRTSIKGNDGEINYVNLACSREGNRSKMSKIPCSLKTLPTKVSNCPARLALKLRTDGLWEIKKFEGEHFHEMSPTKARLFRVNKKINLRVKRTIQINDEAGVRINKTFQSLVTDAGGHANIPFCERDVRNYVNKERRSIGKGGDGKALISYFYRMREQNSKFFYELDLDDGFHVRNVFWADPRSRAAYEYFGDVVTFDTTYLTNKYDMPFAAFVGVNHHGQSTLLGCGLVSGEDTGSFVWLFQSWLRCMLGKAPVGIVTDQCTAMKNAIELVFPMTLHRWCLWHIMKKIPEKLSGFGEYHKIKAAMKQAVYDTYTEADFEDKWCSFVDKFELQNNEWLSGLYKERHRWAPTLLRKYFWAGMSTTQRSESIHAFFDGYINSTTTLGQFVKQYDNALKNRAEKEFEADFQSMDTIIPCGSTSSIEMQFQCDYTHAKFKEVQAEFRGKMNCVPSLVTLEGCVANYNVLEEMLVGDRQKERYLKVVFNRDNHDVNCECLLFEFRGILCRHVLCVCAQERVTNVPEKYVLPRWKKNIKRKHAYINISYGVKQLKPQMDRFEKLCKYFYEVAETAAESEYATKALDELLHQFNSDMPNMDPTMEGIKAKLLNVSSIPNSVPTCHSPVRVKRKGRPPTKRKISKVDKVVKNSMMKRPKRANDHHNVEGANIGTVGHQINGDVCVESTLDVMTNGDVTDATTLSGSLYISTDAGVSNFTDNRLGTQCPTLGQPTYLGLGNDISNNFCSSSQIGGGIPFLQLMANMEIDFGGLSQLSTNP